jgi:hypothetical protein
MRRSSALLPEVALVPFNGKRPRLVPMIGCCAGGKDLDADRPDRRFRVETARHHILPQGAAM